MDEPDALIEAASAAIDRACADFRARDPEAAARYQAIQEETARFLREHFGETAPKESVHVTWTQGRREAQE